MVLGKEREAGREKGRVPIVLALAFVAALVMGGPLRAGAQDGDPVLTIASPAPGDVISTNDLTIEIQVQNFTLDCAKAGLPDEEGVGHIHVMVDGMTMANLIGFYCSDSITVSGEAISPGPHTLFVGLSTNTHLPVMESIQQVEFDFQPVNPRSLPDANFTGEPGVVLISPTSGATVPPVFTVELDPLNFTAAETLEGKANVPGFGHWHVFVDTDMNGMGMMGDADAAPDASPGAAMEAGDTMSGMDAMPMPGMVAMPGTNVFTLDLSAWGPGEHTIWIEPVQNDHTMFESFGHIEFTVIVDPDAESAG